jgi:hypothetical protein
MRYVISLSGGTASAVAAERAIARHGRSSIDLWFADTAWEDEDLYRFVADLMARWGGELIVHRDGRTPLEVAEQQQVIPNNGIAPCSYHLKIKPFRAYLATARKPLTVCLGLDWREQHRMARPAAAYGEIAGVTVDFPLMWRPLDYRPYSEVVASWGIDPPRLYALGFPHNNCGGRCVRQGIGEWQRLLVTFPERNAEVRDWESIQRAKGGPRANRALLKDRSGGATRALPLAEREQRAPGNLPLFGHDDRFACFCDDV